MAFVDQQRLRTIVEIEENDSYTTHSSSSCFTSPSLNDSPPAIRRLQTLSLAPRSTYDLWNSGIYSPADETTTLNRKLTLNSSDSGRSSVDSSFSSENELSPPVKRYTTKALTIYQIEKAKQRSSTLPRERSRCSFTSSTKVFINENEAVNKHVNRHVNRAVNEAVNLNGNVQESEPATTVLKIYIPPAVEKNVAERIAKHKEALSKTDRPFRMDISTTPRAASQERIVTPKYGTDSSDYRVTAWNQANKEPGKIADFKPEVDRWHEKSGGGAKVIKCDSGSQSPIASSSLLTSSVLVGAEPLTQSETQVEYYLLNCNPKSLQIEPESAGNTLSDVSSCTSTEEFQTPTDHSIRSFSLSNNSTKGSIKADSTRSLSLTTSNSSNSQSSKVFLNGEKPQIGDSRTSLSSTNKPVRIQETKDEMLQDRVVEVGVRPWKSQSVERFTNRPSSTPQLIAEKTRKKVIFPSEPSIDQQQHVYENIDDCRERGVEHPRKILPMPGKRLPFRQPARVPVFSIPKIKPVVESPTSEILDDVGPEISYVSYKFYDKNMQEQNSLSQRCSAQLLRKSAMRLSLPRSRSSGSRKFNNVPIQPKQTPIKTFAPKHPIEPLRYHIATDRTERTVSQLKNEVEDDTLMTVNGKQSCANCKFQLGRGQAMTIDSLGLFYHLHCFRCSDCGVLLSSGNARGMEVRVCGSKIQCNQCYAAETDLHYTQI